MTRYTFFDFYDKKRKNPIEIDGKKKLFKGNEISLDDVIYSVTKVFNKKNITGPCAELKMIRYPIPATSTSFIHKCPARQGEMEKLPTKAVKDLKKKYNPKLVDGWIRQGRVKMHGMKLTNICPHCHCTFFKDEIIMPEEINITRIGNKKRLQRR